MLKQSRFIRSLFNLLENKSYSQIIEWNDDGSAFIVKDPKAMPSILRYYFKDVTLKSFFRKLCLYGFVIQKHLYRQKMYRHEYFNKNMDKQDKILRRQLTTSNYDTVSRESHQLMRQLSELKQHQMKMSEQIKQTLHIQGQACRQIQRCHMSILIRKALCKRTENTCKTILGPLFKILVSHQDIFDCEEHLWDLMKVLHQSQDVYTPVKIL